jgi:hypothetical protein
MPAGIPVSASRFMVHVSKFLHAAHLDTAVKTVAHPRRTLQRIVSRVPIVSKFLTFFVPEQLNLEPKGPEAEALRAEIHQEMAVAATPRLKPRFNRPAGPKGPKLG